MENLHLGFSPKPLCRRILGCRQTAVEWLEHASKKTTENLERGSNVRRAERSKGKGKRRGPKAVGSACAPKSGLALVCKKEEDRVVSGSEVAKRQRKNRAGTLAPRRGSQNTPKSTRAARRNVWRMGSAS